MRKIIILFILVFTLGLVSATGSQVCADGSTHHSCSSVQDCIDSFDGPPYYICSTDGDYKIYMMGESDSCYSPDDSPSRGCLEPLCRRDSTINDREVSKVLCDYGCSGGVCNSCTAAYSNSCDTTDGCGGTRTVTPYNNCDLSSNTSCGTETQCDGIDNDCDGQIDDDFDCTLCNTINPNIITIKVSAPTGIINESTYTLISESETVTFEWNSSEFDTNLCLQASGFTTEERNGFYITESSKWKQIGGDNWIFDYAVGDPNTYTACVVGELPYPTPVQTYVGLDGKTYNAPPYTTRIDNPIVDWTSLDGFWFNRYGHCVKGCGNNCEKSTGEKLTDCSLQQEYQTSPTGTWITLTKGTTLHAEDILIGENYFAIRTSYDSGSCPKQAFTFTASDSPLILCGDGTWDSGEECDGTPNCIPFDETNGCRCNPYSVSDGAGNCILNEEICNGIDDDGDKIIDEDFECAKGIDGCDENCRFETTQINSIVELGGEIIESKRIAAVIECLYDSTVTVSLRDSTGTPLSITPITSDCNNEMTTINILTTEDLNSNTLYALSTILPGPDCSVCAKTIYLEDASGFIGTKTIIDNSAKANSGGSIPDNNPLLILLLLLTVSIILTKKHK